MASYYVSTVGNDAGFGTQTDPWRTINRAAQSSAASDIVYIVGGVYIEKLEWFGWPGGAQANSWSTAITFVAYQGQAVTVRGPSGADWVVLLRGSGSGASDAPRYLIFDGLTFDGTQLSNDSNQLIGIRAWDNTTNPANAPSHHIRFQNCRVTGIPHGQGLLITWGSDAVQLINCEVDHIGGPTTIPNNTQGIYGAANDLLVEGCHFHDCWGYGISNISSVSGQDNSNQIIRNNRVHHCGQGGTGLGGINLGEGTGNEIYDNLVYSCQGPGIILAFGAGSDGTKIYHNTVVGNSGRGIWVRPADTNAVVRNNISYGNGGGDYLSEAGSTTEDHNLFGTDPLFTNAGAGNFSLSSGSPALGIGTLLAGVPRDFTGATWVSPPDAGAYKFGSDGTAPAGSGGDEPLPGTPIPDPPGTPNIPGGGGGGHDESCCACPGGPGGPGIPPGDPGPVPVPNPDPNYPPLPSPGACTGGGLYLSDVDVMLSESWAM